MKFIPILFSTAMVQALQAGTKTQTRRVVNKKYDNTDIDWKIDKYGKRLVERQNDVPEPVKNEDGTTTYHVRAFSEIKCPYGAPSDILWVRETFYAYGWWKKEGLKLRFVDFTVVDMDGKYHYEDNRPSEIILKRKAYEMGWYKRPAIFMPRAACRLFLKIKSIRVERLQEISEADAKAEGVAVLSGLYKNYSELKEFGVGNHFQSSKESFVSLWQRINGPESWKANPWVWVIEFERVDKPENF